MRVKSVKSISESLTYIGISLGIKGITELIKRYAGGQTILLFQDNKNPKLYVYMPFKKLSKSEMLEIGNHCQDQTGHRLMYVGGYNFSNYAVFLNSYTDKYIVSFNFFIDKLWD